MLMCYFPHSSGENTSEALLIAAFLFFSFFARRSRAYSRVCFRVVVCNKANTLKWQMHPGGEAGWRRD